MQYFTTSFFIIYLFASIFLRTNFGVFSFWFNGSIAFTSIFNIYAYVINSLSYAYFLHLQPSVLTVRLVPGSTSR